MVVNKGLRLDPTAISSTLTKTIYVKVTKDVLSAVDDDTKVSTILAINMRTALKCHNSLNFDRREMIFFSKFASSKNLSNETKLVPVSLFV